MLFAVESFFSYLDEADRRTSSAASCRQRQNDSRREWGRDGTGPSPVRPEIVCVCLYVGHHSSPGAIVDTSTTDSKYTHLLLSIYWRVGPKAFLYRWSWFSFLPLTNDVVLSSPTYCTDSFMGLDCRTLLRIPIRQHVLLYICLHRRLALTLVYGIDWDRGCY